MKTFFTLLISLILVAQLCSQVNPQQNFEKGLEAYYQARFNDAIGYFDFYTQGYPNDYKGYMFKGLCYIQLEQNQNAIDQMGKALQLQPMNSEVLTYMGYIKVFDGIYQGALEDFKNAVIYNLQNIHALIGRGMAYLINGNYGAAINDYNSAEALNVPSFWLYINKGMAFSFNRDSVKAFESFSKAIELDPNNSLVTTSNNRDFDRNLVFMQFKIINSVIKRLDELISMTPDYYQYYLTRSFFYLAIRKLDLAESDLRKSKSLHPYSAAEFNELADKLEKKLAFYK